jgi:hypothetical protein
VAKKKTKKEMKRLKRRAKKLTATNLRLKRRIRKLKKRLGAQKSEVAKPQGGSNTGAPITETSNPDAEIGTHDPGGIASSQRAAWKQHKYLRDRYELHLSNGVSKDRARELANDDLKSEYGEGSGYSEEELSAILS